MGQLNELVNKAIFKFNNRHGALLCSGCRVILKAAHIFSAEEMTAMKGEGELEAQYCKKCEEEKHMEDIRDETNWNLDTEGGEG
jgi:hypothetical protein